MNVDFTAANFNERFDAINNEVTFNANWSNGCGYYPNAIRGEHGVKLVPGELAKSTATNNRKMIFVGTRLGTLVVFERFANGEKGVYVLNAPHKLNKLRLYSTSGGLNEADMTRIIGTKWDHKPTNIGTMIEAIIEAVNTTTGDEDEDELN